MNQKKNKPAQWLGILVFIILLPLLAPLLLCIGAAYLITTVLVYLAVWMFWNTRGIYVLFVYSNSPHWQSYIQNDILPRLPKGQIVMNWSERKLWKYFSLSSIVFHHFGTYREFNPMAVIIRPFRRARIFRFFEPFRDFKHGNPESLRKMEAEFFSDL